MPQYNPNQPRVPKGRSNGGEWTSGSAGSISSLDLSAQRKMVPPGRPPALYFPKGGVPTPQQQVDRIFGQIERSVQKLGEAILEQYHLIEKWSQKRELESALSHFDIVSSTNSKDSRAVLELRARDFDKKSDPVWTDAHIDFISEEELQSKCKRFEDVVEYANAGALEAKEEGLTGSAFGNRVHRYVEEQVRANKDPKFRAELSYVLDEKDRSAHKPPFYSRGKPIATPSTHTTESKVNALDSVRVDVIEKVKGENTYCIYDIKTGGARLSTKRMREILARVAGHHADARFIIIQVQPDRNGGG